MEQPIHTIADRCRWENLGYRDGKLGGADDIQKRLDEYERNTKLYGKSISALQERIKELEDEK